ncbi:hypothetical protein MATL_G00011080 [Megalops atlanticus]|uniref:Uncharacterized protein n=1 Tax=Megalops atlanticus TaxID=7932 RepID=A0A9D3QH37_MEGAT|nr:hypothetical protein MATL_G00011080 [Megalops atlanticus]
MIPSRMSALQPCREGSSLRTAFQHVAVLVLLPIAGLLLHLVTYITIDICSCSNNTYVVILLSFFGPVLALLAIAAALQKRNIFCNLKSTLLRGPCQASFWKSIFMCVYPSVYWVAILMIDGSYYRCYNSSCRDDQRRDYYYGPSVASQDMVLQSKVIGFALILVLALLVLFYLCCERCCRTPAWRLREECEHALQREREESVRRFVQAFAKREAALQEVRLYETPLQNPGQSPVPGPAAPDSIPRSLTAQEVIYTFKLQPTSTLYG